MNDAYQLLVIIPAFNEEATIEQVIAAIPKHFPKIQDTQILVVDDGSSDATVQCARRAGASVISHHRNRGVGAAMQTGFAEAIRRGVDIAVNIDADGQFNPEDISRLIQPILDGQAGFVTASRFKDTELIPDMPLIKLQGNRLMSRLISFLTGNMFHDVSCGFRAYSREALLRLSLQGQFTYTQESFLILSFQHFSILEVPVVVRGQREHGQSRVASNLWTYAFRTLTIIFNCFRDYRAEIFFNTIVSILLIIAFAFGSFFLGHRLFYGTFTPHIWSGFVAASFFFLAVIGFFVGQLASMINRVRHLQEEQLYLTRLQLKNNMSTDNQ